MDGEKIQPVAIARRVNFTENVSPLGVRVAITSNALPTGERTENVCMGTQYPNVGFPQQESNRDVASRYGAGEFSYRKQQHQRFTDVLSVISSVKEIFTRESFFKFPLTVKVSCGTSGLVSRKIKPKPESINVALGPDLLSRVEDISDRLGLGKPDVVRLAVRAGLPWPEGDQSTASATARRSLEAAL